MKIILSGVLSIAMCMVTSVSVMAIEFPVSVNGIYYDGAENDGVKVVSGNIPYSGNLSIPSSVTLFDNGYGDELISKTLNVTEIDADAFNESPDLVSVSIPSTVIKIGDFNFNNDFYSFSVRSDKFEKYIVDAANPNYLSEDGVLYNKNQTILVDIPRHLNGILSIPSTLNSSNMERLPLEERKYITELQIPAEFEQGIEFGQNMSLEKITVADGNPVYSSFDGVLYSVSYTDAGKKDIYYIPNAKKGTLIYSKELTTGHFWEGLSYSDYPYITSVVYPNRENMFEQFTTSFYGYPEITIVLPANNPSAPDCCDINNACRKGHYIITEGGTELPEFSFFDWWETVNSSVDITLPSTLKNIAYRAFQDLVPVTDIYCYAGVPPTLGENPYTGLKYSFPSHINIHIPQNVSDAYKSSWSKNASQLINDLPSANRYIVETSEDLNSVNISWKADDNADHYEVDVYSDYAKNNKIASVNVDKQGNEIRTMSADGNTLSCYISGLIKNSIYFYDIIGLSEAGEQISSYSSNFSTDGSMTGVENVSANDAIEIKYLPSNSVIEVNGITLGTTVILSNVNGNILKELSSNSDSTRISTADLQPGLYIIKAGSKAQKIVVNK